MPRAVILLGAGLALALAALWAFGLFDSLGAWAAEGQRNAQNALAGALRRLRAEEPGALAALIALAFGYGVFHAAGPGHGKILIGGYGLAENIRLGPLVAIAIGSSLAQATTAVLLVYSGVWLLDLTREAMVEVTETVFAPASYAAIGLIGIWLIWRGARRLRASPSAGHSHKDHADSHDHHHDAACGCGHAHGPTPEQLSRVQSLRDALLVIGAIAIRPCTGALFLLILCWRLGIDAVGIAGAYAMGLGTALITVAVAGLSVWARAGTLEALSGGRLARAAPVIEVFAGLVVVLLSVQMLRAAI
jgi:nickel/cobalt transporter (NicO) family protein